MECTIGHYLFHPYDIIHRTRGRILVGFFVPRSVSCALRESESTAEDLLQFQSEFLSMWDINNTSS
jgi:hypothetical protein